MIGSLSAARLAAPSKREGAASARCAVDATCRRLRACPSHLRMPSSSRMRRKAHSASGPPACPMWRACRSISRGSPRQRATSVSWARVPTSRWSRPSASPKPAIPIISPCSPSSGRRGRARSSARRSTPMTRPAGTAISPSPSPMSFQRKGVGLKMMSAMERHASDLGHEMIAAETARANAEMRGLAKKAGFENRPRRLAVGPPRKAAVALAGLAANLSKRSAIENRCARLRIVL